MALSISGFWNFNPIEHWVRLCHGYRPFHWQAILDDYLLLRGKITYYWTYCWSYDEYVLFPITNFIHIFHTLIFIGTSQGRYIPRLRKLLSESDSDDSESPAPSDQVTFVEVSFVSNKSYIAKTKDSLFLSLTGATKKKTRRTYESWLLRSLSSFLMPELACPSFFFSNYWVCINK